MAKDVRVETAVDDESREDVLVEKIAGAVAAATAQATIAVQERIAPIESRKPSEKSAFNPTGGPRPKLERKMFLAGAEMSPHQLTNEEIELLNQLKPGVYHNGQWRVRRLTDGGTGEALFIDLPVKDRNSRFDLPRSLSELCRQMINEAPAKA